jgi:hypothetical protein
MKFEQVALDCTWGIDQLTKGSFEFQICEFLDLLQEFDSNSFEFLL